MKALILNSGIGSRMGEETEHHPKCMTKISKNETILSRQLKYLSELNINEVIITTGRFDEILIDYCKKLNLPIKFVFVKNFLYEKTNYIYSIYCAREELNDDIILMHGDLVYSKSVLKDTINNKYSCMIVSSTVPLPQKDFKAVVEDEKIKKIGVEFFDNALSAQPLYKLKKSDWRIWLEKIVEYCERNERNCYAENAFNEISNRCIVYPLDIKNKLCMEIDDLSDLKTVKEKLKNNEE